MVPQQVLLCLFYQYEKYVHPTESMEIRGNTKAKAKITVNLEQELLLMFGVFPRSHLFL